ncbi:MAG: hypothetical protein NZM43_04710 [Saprospiraceae bacterium]|nr:hypothetical protein [Saprospiraceae bacterium]MDW8483610.1 hypothetical protein [Saprospiraceae bacterium]
MTEAKALFDFLQYLLSQDIWARWIACVLLVAVLWTLGRIFRVVIRAVWQGLRTLWRLAFAWNWSQLVGVALLGTFIWALSTPLIDILQEMEQRYLAPVYLEDYIALTEAHQLALFEEELRRYTDPYEHAIITQRTREMAQKVASIPLAIYEAAYLECGLKPFEIRSDGIAAGWIQFTRKGVGGLRYRGKPVSFEDVLQACQRRDVHFIMDLTEQYLLHKYEQAGRRPLHNTIDLYLALFAPAFIGAPHHQVVYAGKENPSYYKNAGLDGWYVVRTSDGRQQIFNKRSARDGYITVWEIYLALEAKKRRLFASYLKR